jgi:UDP-N-acetyl-D-glucosamine/UDP-N-acetyl-D-galactosamine dehydrogenase
MTNSPARVAVLGLGYVGLPLVLAFHDALGAAAVVGFDINTQRVTQLNAGLDTHGEAGVALTNALVGGLRLSAQVDSIADANVFVVTVPTPVNEDKRPDLSPLESACALIAPRLKKGDVVIFESTVYPGCTEEFCAPLLERHSGLKFNTDFFLGYSPERINPGDRRNLLASIVKITAGSTPETAAFVDTLYQKIITAGTFRAANIRTAEAAKVFENVQRDVNIALVNEFAQACAHLKLDSESVLAAARTKWNFLDFRPGLVGGHCIGVDPYYLIHRAQLAGFHPALIATARVINEGMAGYICAEVLKLCARRGLAPAGAKVLILGAAFKENSADTRNSRVFDIAAELRSFGADVAIHDPVVAVAAGSRIGNEMLVLPEFGHYDLTILAVAHTQFIEMGAPGIRKWLKANGLIYDVKRVLPALESDARL